MTRPLAVIGVVSSRSDFAHLWATEFCSVSVLFAGLPRFLVSLSMLLVLVLVLVLLAILVVC